MPIDAAAARLEVRGDDAARMPLRVDVSYQLAPFLLADALSSPPLEHGVMLQLWWTGLPLSGLASIR